MANKKVCVAIIGVGNCASSLVQGIQFHKDTANDATVPGIMHTRLGGYHIRDSTCREKVENFIAGKSNE